MKFPWFRLHTEARIDNKLRSLTDAQFRVWFNLICFAADQPERGKIDHIPLFVLAVETSGGDTELLCNACIALQALHVVTADLSDPEAVEIEFKSFRQRQSDKPSDDPDRVRDRVQKSRDRKRLDAAVSECNAPVTPLYRDVSRSNAEREREIREELNPPPPLRGGGDSPQTSKTAPPKNEPEDVERAASLAERLFPGRGYPAKVRQLEAAYRMDWLEAAMTRAFESDKGEWSYISATYRGIASDGGPKVKAARASPPRPAKPTMAENRVLAKAMMDKILAEEKGALK